MIKVGVIRGGISSEYEVSLKTGENVLSHLRGEELNHKYSTVDIIIDRDGVWYINGLPTTMEKIFHKVDVIFNALHGDFGEDGKLQQILEQWKIPYTGSGPLASSIGYNKALSKEVFNSLGIKTPQHILFPAYLEDMDSNMKDGEDEDEHKKKYAVKKAGEVFRKLAPPWIVKPLTGGSSMGVHMCKTLPALVRAFEVGANEKVSVIVEELIEGKEATVGVVNNFRGQDIYVLPPIEIRVPKNFDFFDYEAKYSGKSEEICPGCFKEEEKRELERLALLIHSGLNLSHYSRSDFIVHPKKGIYALEVNTLPGLTNESLIPKGLRAVGASVPQFIDHIIKMALNKK